MHPVDYAFAVIAVAAATGIYLARCRLYPYGPCRACQGRRGRNVGSGRRVWGRCRRCGGTGERLRWGARVFGGRSDDERR